MGRKLRTTGKRETRESNGTYDKDKGGKGCCQRLGFLESCHAGGATDSGRKAKPGGGSGVHWMRRLVKQAMEHQG